MAPYLLNAYITHVDNYKKAAIAQNYPLEAKFCLEHLLHLCLLANSTVMSTLTVHSEREDKMARDRTSHPPTYAEAKKMKSLAHHHTHESRLPQCQLKGLTFLFSSSEVVQRI